MVLLLLSIDLGNSSSNSHGQCEQNEQVQNKIVVVVELRRSTILQHVYELTAWCSHQIKTDRWLSSVSAHHTFTLGLPRSCSKCSLEGSLPPMTVMATDTSRNVNIFLLKKLCIVFRNLCAYVCRKLRSKLFITCCFWTSCNLYGVRCRLFRRILRTVVYGICSSALDFLKRSTSSDSVWKLA
jgi:hypothetical protein